jgi:hypothetical protein
MLSAALFIATAVASQADSDSSHGPSTEIHWSERKQIQSPDGRWRIDVVPARGDEDKPAVVFLEGGPGNTRRVLFNLNRHGVLHWAPENHWLVLEDQEWSNSYRLLLFDLLSTQPEATALRINTAIEADTRRVLGPDERINYYFPKFVKWSQGVVIVSVGVVTVRGKTGPFTPHCTGYVVSLEGHRIRARLDEGELNKRYGASCQMFP